MTPKDQPIEIASYAPADRHPPAARLPEPVSAAFAEVVLSLVEELRQEAEEVGRLRARLEAAERRATDAEAVACRVEQDRATDAALADAFADLLESRLREARRRLGVFERWLSDRPPHPW